ncbi:hypothetical protein POF51_02745 [Brevibacillus sp. AG]|uniref:VOC family protein n=1 Tax=Brevibacillus sp. AG TaxID=3020891 RepID=UPI00085389CD|nr:hypothetical protein [Brevibacillus sp. AG]MDC0759603.1 hypothetical protein [Brevibacillus sp. AG]
MTNFITQLQTLLPSDKVYYLVTDFIISEQKGIEVTTSFGFPPEKQPLVLPNNPQAHAAIYFEDPDGNLLEFIAPLRIDFEEAFKMMTLEEWDNREG